MSLTSTYICPSLTTPQCAVPLARHHRILLAKGESERTSCVEWSGVSEVRRLGIIYIRVDVDRREEDMHPERYDRSRK